MENQIEGLWKSVSGELQVSMSEASYNSWIKPCFIKSLSKIYGKRIIVEMATSSGFHLKTIDERYYGQIKKIIEKITEKKCELALVVERREVKEEKVEKESEEDRVIESKEGLFSQPESRGSAEGLNPRFTFDTYVVGSSNNLAFAAAKAVVENPGTRHNPLFIWGGVGTGKTHLMQAIGHGLSQEVNKVVYVTSEQFANDLINSLRMKTVDGFKKKYRQVGALLVDDVQFFSKKESTQEEFFHTFNELYMKGVQIILTSDKKPQEIGQLEERLVSRFLGGLTVDISLPDYEMRVAILRQKAGELKIEVSDRVIDLIASNMKTNSRELEGMFIRLVNAASLNGGVISEDLVRKTMKVDQEVERQKPPRPIKVISVVAKYFDYRNKDLTGKSRKADLVAARHVAMYLLREELGLQLVKVGELMGGRDHTTVMHGVEKIKGEVETDKDVRNKVMNLKHSLYSQS